MKTTKSSFLKHLALFAALASGLALQAQTTTTWTNLASGSWTNSVNWTNSFGVNLFPSGTGNTADFSELTLGSSPIVTLDGPRTIGNLLFGDQGSTYNWTLNTGGGGPLTLAVSTGTPIITVNNGIATNGAVLAGSQGLIMAGAGTLYITSQASYTGGTTVNAGTLKLGTGGGHGCINGALTINNGATVTAAAGNALGYNGGANQVTTLNNYGGTFTSAVSGDEGWGITINLMGGTMAAGSGDFSMGGGWVINTIATNVTSTISGTIHTRNAQPNNQIPFNVAAGTASPDLLVSGVIDNTQSGDGIVKAGAGVMTLSAANTFNGATLVNAGILTFTSGGSAGTAGNSAIIVTNGAELDLNGSDVLGYGSGSALTVYGTVKKIYSQAETLFRPITLSNGMLTNTLTSSQQAYETFGNYILTAANTTNWIAGAGQFGLRTSTCYITNAIGSVLNIASVIYPYSSGCPLNKMGPGKMVMLATNIYNGSTVVNGGTLEVDGATGTGAVTVGGGAVLDGTGTVQGATTIQSGGTLLAGTSVFPGTLSISNSLTFLAGSTNLMHISKTGGTPASDLFQGLTVVTYGGTLVVTNVTSDATAFAAGDAFQLFSSTAYGGGFGSILLPSLPAGLAWNTSQLTVNGTLTVIAGTTPPSFSPPGGGYVGAVSVTISSTAGTTILYTTDGSNPTTSGTRISGASPVSGIVIPVSTTETISAYATNALSGASSVVSATYTTVPTAIWTNTAGGTWGVPANWNVGAVANASGVTADFSQLTLFSNLTVSVGSSETIGTLLFEDQGNAYSWALNGGATLTLNAGASVPSIVVSNQSLNISATLASATGLNIYGEGGGAYGAGASTMTLSSLNNSFTNLTLSGISVTNTTAAASASTTFDLGAKVATSTITVNSNSMLTFTINNIFGGGGMTNTTLPTLVINGLVYSTRYNALPNIVLNGGTLDQNASDGGNYQGYQFVGSVTVGGSAASTISTDNGKTDDLLGSGTTFNVAVTGAAGPDLIVSAPLANASSDYGASVGSLIKTGAGTMSFAGANTFTGPTIVSNGTLEVDGATGTGVLTINSGGTVDGTGTVNGIVSLNGGTLSAGTAASMGTLQIGTALSLTGGTTALRINKTGGSLTYDLLAGMTSVTYGGTLKVSNLTSDGTLLATGDTFYLFNAGSYHGLFTTLNLPTLPAGLFWDTSGLTGNGSISVTANAPTPVFNPLPGGYIGTLTVTISSAPGSTIHYTTDGSDPMSSGTVLSSPTPATVVVPVNTPSEYITAYASLPAGPSVETYGIFSTVPIPTWITPGGGNWSSTGNWSNNVVANGVGETADFSTQTLSGGDGTVTLDIAPTVGNLLFADQGNAYNWIIADGGVGPLTLAVSSGSPTITVENQTTLIQTVVAGTNGLTKAGAGSLVLTNLATYTGNTIVNAGNLVLATNGATGVGILTSSNLTVNPGASVTASAVNALGYNTSEWVRNLNLYGGTFTSTANGDQGWGLTVNMMGGTLASSGTGSHIAAGGTCTINTLATNIPSVISGTLNARDSNLNPTNLIPFNVASSGGAASPDLLVSATIANATAGVGIVKNGPGVMSLATANSFSGPTIVSNGVLQLTGGGGTTGTLSNSAVTVESGTELQAFTGDGLGSTYNAVRTLTLNGGTLREINTNSETLARPITMINGTITANPGEGLTAGGAILAQGSQGDCFNLYGASAIVATAPSTTNYINLPAGCYLALRGGSISNAANAYLIVNGVLNGWGGSSAYALTLTGPGTTVLTSNNTYSGSTALSAGNLEVDGSIAGGSGVVTVSGGILDGNGTINGPTTVAAGGLLMAGTLASPGILSINNVLTFSPGGTNFMRLSKTGGTLASDRLQGMSIVNYGGTLIVSNLTSDGTQFAVGDTIHLFTASGYSGSFASIQGLPALTNPSWSWDTSQLPVNGTIRVINGTGTPSFNPPGGDYVGAQSVTITSDAGSTIFYTTDGSNPTTSATRIAGASPLSGILVPSGITETITAYATNTGTGPSLVASATYVTVSTAVWTNTAGGSWATPVNWYDSAVGNGSAVTADFSTLTLPTNTTVTLSGSQTIGTLLFKDQGNAYGWILNGGGVLTMDAGSTVPKIVVNNQSVSLAPTLAGTNGLLKAGAGLLSLTAANSYSGTTVVSNGVLELSGNGGSLGTLSNTPVTVEIGAELQAFAGDVLGYTYSPVRTLTLNGGILREVSSNSETLGRPITLINGTITANPGAGNQGAAVLGDCYNLFNATAIVTTAPNTTNYISLPAACHFALRGGSFNLGAGSYLMVNGILDGWEGGSYTLTTTGPGTMVLSSNNTYTGSTVVSNGTLEVDGSIASAGISIMGGTLDGSGSIAGDVVVGLGATLSAGTAGAIGTLTINNSAELSGTVALKVSKTGGVLANDSLAVTAGVTYGGTLSVANVTSDGTPLAKGDAFSLFVTPGSSGSFSATNLPALPNGLGWSWNPATGLLTVVTGSYVNTDPATVHFQAVTTSGSMQLSWAPDHLGWQLYTNSVGLAAPNSWFPVPGSSSVSTETITINPSNPNVFFQLRYP